MFYKLRDHIPRDYAAMHEGQNVDNDQGEFHDSFQYQPCTAGSGSALYFSGDPDEFKCPKRRCSCSN